jgi:hypothetical protein
MKFVRSALVAATAAVVTLAPTAAHAKRYSHVDAPGDVLSGPVTSTGNPTTLEAARTNGDVVSSSVAHKSRKVVMRMQFRDIAWDSEVNAYLFKLRTGSMTRYVTVYASDGFRGGRAQMTKTNGKRVSCHLRRSIDYTANNVTVSVPRSCLGKPRWVKVGMGSLFFTGFGTGDTEYVDDALRTGPLGSDPALGPKVRR